MKPVTSIDDPRYVKAMSHPLRVRILAILMERDKMSDEDALDYFSYNTMRALPYIHQHTPVIFWRAPA